MKPKNKYDAKLLIFEPFELPNEWIDTNQEIEVYTYDGIETIIIRLKKPITRNGRTFEFFIGNERNNADINQDYNLIRIDGNQVDDDGVFNLKWWRGGDAFIGTLMKN